MLNKISDLHIFCDIDGTLGDQNEGIPERNFQAIRRFVEKGGRFSLCTGRWIQNITKFVEGIPYNFPAIVGNGAGIYDFNEGKFLFKKPLPEKARDYLKIIMKDFPEIDVLVISEEGYYLLGEEKEEITLSENFPKYKRARLEEIHGELYKFFFWVDAEKRDEIYEKLRGYNFENISIVRSIADGIEILPEKISKGSTFLEMCQRENIDIEKTIFIGDFYNDLEMFTSVGLSACPKETPEDLKEKCDIIMGKCMDGAVADLIEFLEYYFDEE